MTKEYGLEDLRLEHFDPRLGGAQFGLGGLHVFLAGGIACHQTLLALVLLARQFVLGPLFLQLGLEVFDGVAAGVEFGFLRGRVDFHQQLAFLDLVTGLDVDLLDLPGRLGAHIHITTGLQGTQRGDAVFDIAAGHRDCSQGVAAGWQYLPGGNGDDGDQACDN